MWCDKTVKNYNFTEAQSYIFFGVLTTAVNFITYVFFTKALGIDYKIAASLAWVAAVIFAFITNKLYVFKSAATSALAVAKELGSFYFSGSYPTSLISSRLSCLWKCLVY